jgi:hypothetical protein
MQGTTAVRQAKTVACGMKRHTGLGMVLLLLVACSAGDKTAAVDTPPADSTADVVATSPEPAVHPVKSLMAFVRCAGSRIRKTWWLCRVENSCS